LGDNILPPEATKIFPEIHSDYLAQRNFNPDKLIAQYDLYSCFNLGKYKFRIIIPVIEDGFIVNFTALSVSGQDTKYVHCSNSSAIIPMKECLYNIDSVKDVVLITEGVTDVWRMGDGCVATMGIEYTSEQIRLLVNKGVKKAYVMFDSEDFAIRKARKLADTLSIFMESEVIELADGDPGEFTDQQVLELREEIFK
jgi:DNA primase